MIQACILSNIFIFSYRFAIHFFCPFFLSQSERGVLSDQVANLNFKRLNFKNSLLSASNNLNKFHFLCRGFATPIFRPFFFSRRARGIFKATKSLDFAPFLALYEFRFLLMALGSDFRVWIWICFGFFGGFWGGVWASFQP